jgi:hypothetical protein
MIVSHRHKLIFVKTRKVAGTSFEIALSGFLGPEDVITPITEDDEAIRRARGWRGPQNYTKPPAEWTPGEWVRAGRRLLKGQPGRARPAKYVNHIPAVKLRARLGAATWDAYTKVSIDRNPFDLAVSLYHYFERDGRRSFAQFVHAGGAYRGSNFDLYAIDGVPAMDRLLRYETLDAELEALGADLGLGAELAGRFRQIRAKGDLRPDRDYRDRYDADTRRLIEIQFAREIALLGYVF